MVTAFIAVTTLLSFIVPSIYSVYAHEVAFTTEEKEVKNTVEDSSYDALNYLSLNQSLMLEEELEKSVLVDNNDGDEIATISDRAIVLALEKVGYEIDPLLKKQVMLRGDKKKGNFDVYLSKTTLQVIKLSAAAYNLLRSILAAYMGNLIGTGLNAMKAILNITNASFITSGKVFYIRSWWYTASASQ